MGDIAIRATSLSKQYRIGTEQKSYATMRDSLAVAMATPFRWMRKLVHGQATKEGECDEAFWALKDVSFEINYGEVVGIIGRNGAGKSTLLKILSCITEPTLGQAEIHGRVGSLLEVGTGFHPELTGRENVYLNGAILGLRKAELDRKFDAIVNFAEVKKFIDTPVKHYSSGMSVRLAFAVAAHLEPEILIIDEVLAVGDIAFQKKCFGKLSDVTGSGRTVLFVSHNMQAIQSLCSRVVLLDGGKVVYDGAVEEGIRAYLATVQVVRTQSLECRADRTGGETFRFVSVEFLDADTRRPMDVLVSGREVIIRFKYHYHSNTSIDGVEIAIAFFTETGSPLFVCENLAVREELQVYPGEGQTECRLKRWPLKAGRYSYRLFAGRKRVALDWVHDAGTVDVVGGDYYGSGRIPGENLQGVLVDFSWDEGGCPGETMNDG